MKCPKCGMEMKHADVLKCDNPICPLPFGSLPDVPQTVPKADEGSGKCEEIKVGDEVLCIDNKNVSYIKSGVTYIVTRVGDTTIDLEGVKYAVALRRFCKLHKPVPVKAEGEGVGDKRERLDHFFMVILNNDDYKNKVVEYVCKYTGYVAYQRDYNAIVANILPVDRNLLYAVIQDIIWDRIKDAQNEMCKASTPKAIMLESEIMKILCDNIHADNPKIGVSGCSDAVVKICTLLHASTQRAREDMAREIKQRLEEYVKMSSVLANSDGIVEAIRIIDTLTQREGK